MRYHWIRNAKLRRLFQYYWTAGSVNEADYFTKHHPPNYHREMRERYILKGNSLTHSVTTLCSKFLHTKKTRPMSTWRGCVGDTTTPDPRNPGSIQNREVTSALTTHTDRLWRDRRTTIQDIVNNHSGH